MKLNPEEILRTIGDSIQGNRLGPGIRATGVDAWDEFPKGMYGKWKLPLPGGGNAVVYIESGGNIKSPLSDYRTYNFNSDTLRGERGKHDLGAIARDTFLQGHPVVSWDLDEEAYKRLNRTYRRKKSPEERKAAVVVGREAMSAVSDFLKAHSDKYAPSAYEFSPTSRSRGRLYKGSAERMNSDYEFNDPQGEGNPDLGYRLTRSPKLWKDIVQGLALTAPIAGLGYAATDPEDVADFLSPQEEDDRSPGNFIKQTIRRK